MNYKLQVAHDGIIKNITIEPSVYQNKKVYQVTTDNDNFVLYHDGNEWKQDESHNGDPEWLAKAGEAINAIETLVSLPTF